MSFRAGQATVAAMATKHQLMVVCWTDGSSLIGEIRAESKPARAFEGWLDLLAGLEAAIEPEPSTHTTDPQTRSTS